MGMILDSLRILAMVALSSVIYLQSAGAQTMQQVVDSFFPARLINDSEADFALGGPRPFRASAFAVGDLKGNGSSHVVALYSNGFEGVARILEGSGSTYQMVYETEGYIIPGDFPQVELRDITGDNRPDALLYLTQRGPRHMLIVRWNGTNFDVISPTVEDEYGFRTTLLTEPRFIDLDGDGTPEMIHLTTSYPPAPSEVPHYEVLKYNGQNFISVSENVFKGEYFVRQAGSPNSYTKTFAIQSPGSASMSIINGAAAGTDRLSSATVKLNGEVIVSSNDLNQQIYVLVFEVPVSAENTLEVEVRGQPGSYLTVAVQR